MKTFKCTVTRTDEYEIQLDETKMTPEWMTEFAESMYSFSSLKEHAQHLAQLRARFPEQSFFEGYGSSIPTWQDTIRVIEVEPGVSIKVVSEDDDINVDVEEV